MADQEVIKLKLLAVTPGSRTGSSPSLFRSEDGRLFIQGFLVGRAVGEAAQCPPGETIVEVDQGLLEEIRKLI